MGKFEIFFKANIIEEWKNNYIDYTKFKEKLKFNKFIPSNNNDKLGISVNDSLSVERRSSFKEEDNLKTIIEKDTYNVLKEFLSYFEGEIKKLYIFYTNLERELYVLINSHLYLRKSYNTFNCQEILKELNDLMKIANKTLLLCTYISINMTSIRKILRKFDKKFSYIYGEISIKFLKEATDNQNNDLIYILQFKIIDEVSALIEDLLIDLKDITNKRKNQIKKLKITNIDHENNKNIPLTGSEINLKDVIYDKIEQLNNNLISIDESNSNYRATFKSWNTIAKEGNKVIYNQNSFVKDNHRSIITMDDEPIINKIMRDKIKEKGENSVLSKENKTNLILSLIHTTFYMMAYLILFPTNWTYLHAININSTLSGLILAITPFSSVFSTLLFSRWSDYSYKETFVFSLLCLFSGNFIYSTAFYFQSLFMICLGRSLIGFGSARILNRRYILEFLPKTLLNKYGFMYTCCGTIGFFLGPIIAYLLLFIEDEYIHFDIFIFNKYTNPGWFCSLFSLVFLIITIYLFTEPRADNFKILLMDINRKVTPCLTNEDKKMVYELERKLSEINNQNNFSDSNLVTKNIELLSFKEKNKYSYIFRFFFIGNLILFSLRLSNEAIFVQMFFYLGYIHEFSLSYCALLACIGLGFTIPITFYFRRISFLLPERKLIVLILCLCILSSIFLTGLIITTEIVYEIFLVLLIILNCVLENSTSGLIAKIVPADYKIKKISAGFVLGFISSIGRIIGSCLLTISARFGEENISVITYSICAIFYILNFALVIIFYSDFRVKAIARIIRKIQGKNHKLNK